MNRVNSVGFLLTGIILFFCSSCFAETVGERLNNQSESGGYPEIIREDLHPWQYYCLAKLYASQYKLKQAKICIEKLRACEPKKESEVLAARLEDTTLPKHPIPEEAVAQLQKATRDKYKTDSKSCRELIKQYPNFEWPYFALVSEFSLFDEPGLKTRKELMEKVLSINPHNVRAHIVLSDVAKRQQKLEEAHAYLSKARAFYPDIILHKEYFVPPTKKEIQKEKMELAEANEREAKRQEVEKRNPEPQWVERKFYFIDKSGQAAVGCGPSVWPEDRYSDGRLIVKTGTTSNMTPASIQVWNRDGKVVFEIERGEAKPSSEGLLAVRKDWDNGRRYSWGFVDTDGKEVVKGGYDDAEPVSEGMAPVQVEDGTIDGVVPWGFVDIKSKLQIEPIYSDMLPFSEGLAPVSLNGKIGFINKNGHFVIPPQFDLARPYSEGIANVVVFDEAKRIWDDRYIDKNGKVLFSYQYEIPGTQSLHEYAGTTNSLNAYKQRFRLLSFDDFDFQDDNDFRNHLALVWDEANYGFKDRSGKFVIKPAYKRAHAFSDGMAIVSDGDKFGFIDREGKMVVPPTFKKVKKFTEGLAAVSTDGDLWGYIDKKGVKVIEEIFLEAFSFSEGLAKVGSAKTITAAAKTDESLTNLQVLQEMPEAAQKIVQRWQCRYDHKVDVAFEFKLNKSGSAYDFHLIKGYDNPFAIQAALHAVLFAMPFDAHVSEAQNFVPRVRCTISGDSKKPTVQVSLLDNAPTDVNAAKDALSRIPLRKPYEQSMFASAMEPRLQELCALLYDYPDSTDIQNEITKLCTFIGLDCSRAHDWLSIARARRNRVPIMRNSAPDTVNACKAAIAAYQRALKLSPDEITRFELEDACKKLVSIELIEKSNADPLLLGNAALLTTEVREAKKQYDASASAGNETAKQILSEMKKNINSSEVSPIVLTKERIPGRDSHGWKPVLYWLPADTELLVKAVPSSIPTNNRSGDILFGPLVTEKAPEEQIEAEVLANNKLFEKCQVSFALHGARVFELPGGLGLGGSQSADLIVFGEDSKGLSGKVIDCLRTRSTFNQVVQGIEVLSFETAPFSFARCVPGNHAQYLCSPYEGVIVAANDLSYLRELLFRMRNPAANRALPDGLPEWSSLDQNADLIVVRHFDPSFVPFDNVGMCSIAMILSHPSQGEEKLPDSLRVNKEVGMVAYKSGKKWTIKQLSNNPDTLKGLLQMWQHSVCYKEGKFESHSSFKGSIKGSVMTIETAPDHLSLMAIQLLLSMGYFVAI